MFRCARSVENADFKRITLKVDQSNSPMANTTQRGDSSLSHSRGKRSVNFDFDRSPSTLPPRKEKDQRKQTQEPPRRSLTNLFDCEKVESLLPLDQTTLLFKSPLEK